MPEIIYLDNSATTKVCAEAAQNVMNAMTETYGNPSSGHLMGLKAEKLMNEARQSVASVFGCAKNEIVFTSGGTEANNLAVFGAARALRRRGNRIVTTQIEHSSVLSAADELQKEGFEVVRLKPDSFGRIREEDLLEAVTKDTVLVSMMLVNNETGAFQPAHAVRAAVKRAGSPALIHCDAVQAFCKMRIDPVQIGADLISVSSHKIHGPKGAGALYVRSGARILPLLHGGSQERGLRPGTENVPAISGFGKAAEIACAVMEQSEEKIAALRSGLLRRLSGIPGITVNSSGDSLPNILNVSLPGIRSEIMLNYLSSKGICISSGSACSRGAKSHVLAAMGLPDSVVDSALRISFSRFNTEHDVQFLAEQIALASEALQKVKI